MPDGSQNLIFWIYATNTFIHKKIEIKENYMFNKAPI